jgi:hypothetical protein
VSANLVRIGDAVSDANDPTITFYSSNANDWGNLSFTDSDEFSFSNADIIFSGNLSSSSSATMVDLSSITHATSDPQGLKLPQNTALTTMGSIEGFIAYDNDDNLLKFYDGSSWVTVSSGTGSSKWTESGGVLYPNILTNDLSIGATTPATAAFGVDESANQIYIGDNTTAGSTTLTFKSDAGADTGNLLYNTSDSFQFSGGDVTIDQDLTLTGGDLLGPSGENIDLGEATADVVTFYTGGSSELGLSTSALYPTTAGGLDLGATANKWGDLYLQGGDIVLDNATDIDIDDTLVSSFSISQGGNNFLAVNTSTDNLSFGNAVTNPTYNFLGTSAVTP